MRRDWGTVHIDTGEQIVFAPAPQVKTTLSKDAEPGQTQMWTAALLPDGATVRVGDETAVVREMWRSPGRGVFAMLAEPLAHSHPAATVVAVIARKGECPHLEAVPVDLLLGGERVAWLRPDCQVQLPAGWKESDDV